MKTTRIIFLLVALAGLAAHAQHTNNGATITIQGGCNVYALAELRNNSGTINNSGNLYVSGHYTNNATINNNSGSAVVLHGGNQTVQGSGTTNFYNLYCQGSGTKTLARAIGISNHLDVGGVVMNTQGFVATVTNASTGAVASSGGYITSSSSSGGLSRPTNSTDGYEFPVGGGSGQRKIIITPESASSQTYKVCEITGNAGGSYSFGSIIGSIGTFNTAYYHHVDRTSGSGEASVSFYYNSGDAPGGTFAGIAKWNGSAWQEVPSFPQTGLPQNWMIGTDISSFSPFVLFDSGAALTVPTLSEWGLIILSLLTLTLVMLFMGRREVAVAGAGRVNEGLYSIIQNAPFSRSLYFGILSLCLLVAIAGFAVVHVLVGTNGLLDLMGTVACSLIVAYMIYLYREFDGFKGNI